MLAACISLALAGNFSRHSPLFKKKQKTCPLIIMDPTGFLAKPGLFLLSSACGYHFQMILVQCP